WLCRGLRGLGGQGFGTRLRPGGTLRRRGRNLRQRTCAGVELGLPGHPLLKSQNRFADFAPAIFHNRRLPLSVRFAQFLDQAAGESILGQSSLESILWLEFFALLCGEISFEENFARIVLLCAGKYRWGEEKCKSKAGRRASRKATV